MSLIGFTFAGRHSSTLGVVMESAERGLLPGLRRTDAAIPRRHGTVRYSDGSYDTRQIAIDICFIKETVVNLHLAAREVAFWLSGRGGLRFDDEPDKYYDAIVYVPADVEQIIRAKRATVTFECQPFAFGPQESIKLQRGMNPADYIGTAETPTLIIIRNPNAFAVSGITVTAVQHSKTV